MQLDLGIDFENGLGQASVFMDVDISGTVDMELSASLGNSNNNAAGNAAAGGVSGTNSSVPNAISANSTLTDATNNTQVDSTSLNHTSNSSVAVSPLAARAFTNAVERASGSVNGCVNVTTAITVSGNLDGALQPLFNDAITFNLFQASAQLFSVGHHLIITMAHCQLGIIDMLWRWPR